MGVAANKIFYFVLLIVSCLVINGRLKRFNMKVARIAFLCLSSVFMLYIPFYFFNTALTPVFSAMYENPEAGKLFTQYMAESIEAPFLLFKYCSASTAVLAIVVTVAAFCVIIRFVHYVCELHLSVEIENAIIEIREKRAEPYIKNYRNTYKTLMRLRN